MATSPSKPRFGLPPELEVEVPALKQLEERPPEECSPAHDALQALLAFSSLNEQVRTRRSGNPSVPASSDQFILYEVLQVVSERALSLTGADGIAIALVQKGEIICRASSGSIAPDIGARLDPKSGFSGTCYRTGEIVRCEDVEADPRVNIEACRRLNTRSMVAVPLRGRTKVVGLIEAFSTDAYGFNDSDVRSLTLLGELILGAMKPEEEEELEATAPVVAEEPVPDANALVAQMEALEQAGTGSESEPKLEAGPEATSEDSSELREFRMHGTLSELGKPSLAGSVGIEPTPAEPPASEPLVEQPPDAPARSSMFEETPAAEEEATPSVDLSPAFLRDYEKTTPSRPGLMLVVVLVVIAILIAAGIWWRLHGWTNPISLIQHAPNETQPEPQTPAAVAPSTTPVATPTDTPIPAKAVVTEPQPDATPVPEAQINVLPKVTGIRHWEAGPSSTVVIDLQDTVQYEVHRLSSPERIYFDLHDTVLAQGLNGKTIEVGDKLLVRIRVAQPMAGISRVVLETNNVSTFSVSLEQNPFRLVAEIRGPALTDEAKSKISWLHPESSIEQKKLSAATGKLSKEDLQLRAKVPPMRVVIDAGHGGWDLGTVGHKGLLEKDLVLEVAQRLGNLLRMKLGTEVIYTRSDDNYIPLDKRAEVANQAGADLFVSVHANYSDLASARGVETYYTNFSSSPDSLEIESRENGNAEKISVGGLLSGVALKERTSESRRLAASVERALYGTLSPKNPGLRDRGVKEAGFVVLTGTSMPAILAEISFLSSPADEQNLQTSSYRQQIAEALYKGIARYAASSDRVKMASNSGKSSGQ